MDIDNTFFDSMVNHIYPSELQLTRLMSQIPRPHFVLDLQLQCRTQNKSDYVQNKGNSLGRGRVNSHGRGRGKDSQHAGGHQMSFCKIEMNKRSNDIVVYTRERLKVH